MQFKLYNIHFHITTDYSQLQKQLKMKLTNDEHFTDQTNETPRNNNNKNPNEQLIKLIKHSRINTKSENAECFSQKTEIKTNLNDDTFDVFGKSARTI